MSERNVRYDSTPHKRGSTSERRRYQSENRDSARAVRARSGASRTSRASAGRPSVAASGGGRSANVLVIGLAALILVALVACAFGLMKSCSSQGDPSAETAPSSAGEEGSGQGTMKATEPFSVSLCTTGDLIFWREVADYIDKNGGKSALEKIAEHLAAADVTISNLESPLSDDESKPVIDKDVYIIGRPAALEGIVASGIDITSLANNHIMDYTGPALKDTLDALDGAGILHAGAGMDEDAAGKPAELTVNGASIAFFSWTDIVPDFFLAYEDEPGVVSARMNMKDACNRVRAAKATHDIVIVAMHWGVEYEDYITDYLQSEPAHQLVDAGADVILGNHPHVMQGIEFYKGALIAYAHGNCVFWQKYDHTHESIILDFEITQDGVRNVTATPLYLDDTYGIPDFAKETQARETLARLEEISEGMNTAFEIRDGKAYITPLD